MRAMWSDDERTVNINAVSPGDGRDPQVDPGQDQAGGGAGQADDDQQEDEAGAGQAGQGGGVDPGERGTVP